jgi:hypothetical protein
MLYLHYRASSNVRLTGLANARMKHSEQTGIIPQQCGIYAILDFQGHNFTPKVPQGIFCVILVAGQCPVQHCCMRGSSVLAEHTNQAIAELPLMQCK